MLKILILFFLFVLLFFLRHALAPLGCGILAAYILDPCVSFLQKKVTVHRLLCIILTYILVILSFSLLIYGFVKILAAELGTRSLEEIISGLLDNYNQYKDVLKSYVGFSLKTPDIPKIVQRIGSSATTFLVGMIIAFYLLKDKALFLLLCNKTMHLFLPQRIHGFLRELLFAIDDVLSSFFRGVFVDSLIVAFLSAVVLSLIQLKFSVFIGGFAGICNIIPYFGPLLGMIPAALIALSTGGIGKALLAIFLLFIVQQIECNFIYPKIIGKTTGLHPLFVLISVSVAGYFGGLFFMILAVPIAGILNVLIKKWAEYQ